MRVAAERRFGDSALLVEPVEPASDRFLIDRARAGDERAFRELVERYEPRVAATVVGMLGAGDEAEDVGQETFIRLYRSLDRFRGDSSLGTYLTRIAINLSLTALKRRKRRTSRFVSRDERERELPETSVDPRGDLERKETALEVTAAVEALAPDHRAVVVLRMIDGLSTRETAEILGIPAGTVMSRLARAMDRLERALKEPNDE
ncbi:MAG: sigma-70 family RNA polymerase sigma factor [Candidatus Palauibacterales bacterium]|nr:sigma-70 family RNA polymerase sigma factor [Candidatus Palauibacterales bacterium]